MWPGLTGWSLYNKQSCNILYPYPGRLGTTLHYMTLQVEKYCFHIPEAMELHYTTLHSSNRSAKTTSNVYEGQLVESLQGSAIY